MRGWFSRLSRPAKVVLILGVLLLLGWGLGLLRADLGVNITSDEATRIAREQIVFQPDETRVRLVRRGFRGQPFWAVSLSQRAPDGQGFARITTVLVDAGTGEIAQVRRAR